MPRLCKVYPGICLTTEEKARKNLSQGSWRTPVGTMKTEYTEYIDVFVVVFIHIEEVLLNNKVKTLYLNYLQFIV
jgi:hypothetical protein